MDAQKGNKSIKAKQDGHSRKFCRVQNMVFITGKPGTFLLIYLFLLNKDTQRPHGGNYQIKTKDWVGARASNKHQAALKMRCCGLTEQEVSRNAQDVQQQVLFTFCVLFFQFNPLYCSSSTVFEDPVTKPLQDWNQTSGNVFSDSYAVTFSEIIK